ncbi:MAG: ROK family protein [Tessaracoccus sp.]
MEGCQVKAELEAATGLPVTVVNDAHAAGLAEHWTGEGQDCAHFICITIGTAVGGAIFINGALYRGFRGAAGELSMIRMGPPLPGEKIPASASHLCGGILGLSRIYSRALGLIEPSTWLTDTWEILRRAEEGDAIAAASVEEFFEHLTILLINTTATLDPERILIGGGLSEREGFVAQVQARLAERIADTTLVAAPEVRACRNGNRAGILGAIHAAHLTA